METKDFTKCITQIFHKYDFEKKGSFFYKKGTEITCVIGVQKSSHSNGYYINVGYLLKNLNKNIEYPRDVDGDIRARFFYEKSGKGLDFFDLDDRDITENLEKIIATNIEFLVNGSLTVEGIKKLIKMKPALLYQTKATAKKYLGYE